MNKKDFSSSAAGRVIRTKQGFYAFVPAPLPPALNWETDLISVLSTAGHELALLSAIGDHFPAPHIMVKSFVQQEAVLSSRIEGTRTTLAELMTYAAAQFDSPDAHEVQNYVHALDYGLKRLDTLPISLRLVRELHEKLMEDTRGSEWTPGKFRKTQNWIGAAGSTLETAAYVPPPVDEMNECLSQMENFIHTTSDLPALIRLGMIHYQFESIHPFLDGNGRVGRLLIPLLMREWNLLSQPLLYLSAYFEANRSEYYARLLGVSLRGEWESWLRFFLQGVQEQSMRSAKVIEALLSLRAEYMEKIASERSAEKLLQVFDFLLGHPIVNIRQLQDGIGLSDFKVASRYLKTLESLGIVSEFTGRARNRLYRADRVMKIIQE